MATSNWTQAYKNKIILPDQLSVQVSNLKKNNQSIVTLNGSFDLMHAGHLHMIYEASLMGDVLIVALNSDKSIQQYKSPTRPIIPLDSRLQMMAALYFVNYVTWFEETDPRKLLSLIQPHVHVNGSEYGKDCIEAETIQKYGGKLHIIELIPGLSTSAIIQKIQNKDRGCA